MAAKKTDTAAADPGKRIIDLLAEKNQTIVTAESCTGGMVAAALDYDLDNLPASPPPHPSPQGGGCRIEYAEGEEDQK